MSKLGRSLESLIPTTAGASLATSVDLGDSQGSAQMVIEIEPSRIVVNKFQPRTRFDDQAMQELISSIKTHGILQPLIVTKVEGQAHLIAGERRLRAAKELQLVKVPVIFRKATSEESLAWALIENIQREDLNPIEKALAYKQLQDDFSLHSEEVAARLGKSIDGVRNVLKYLKLPVEIQKSLMVGEIKEGHAQLLGTLKEYQQQLIIWQQIKKHQLKMLDTRALIKRVQQRPKSVVGDAHLDSQTREHQDLLEDHLGSRTRVRKNNGKGKIELYFFSDDEYQGLVKRIIGGDKS